MPTKRTNNRRDYIYECKKLKGQEKIHEYVRKFNKKIGIE